MNDRIKNCLWGLAAGEALALRAKLATESPVRGLHSQLAIEVVSCLQGPENPDAISKSFAEKLSLWVAKPAAANPSAACLEVASRIAANRPWNGSGVEEAIDNSCVARGTPIGAWASSVGAAAELALECARVTHPNEVTIASAAAAAVICFLAADGLPTGQWAAKAADIVSVNKDFTEALSAASRLAADRVEPEVAMSDAFLGNGDFATETVARAMYCCMSAPSSFADAVALAAGAPGDPAATAALVGAWMATKQGMAAIPEGWTQGIAEDIVSCLPVRT